MKEIELIFRDPTLPFYQDTFKIHRGDCVAVFSSCEIPKFKWAAYIAKFNACINRNFVAACVDCASTKYSRLHEEFFIRPNKRKRFMAAEESASDNSLKYIHTSHRKPALQSGLFL